MLVGLHAYARAHPDFVVVGILPPADSAARDRSLRLDGLVGAFYGNAMLTNAVALGLPAVNVSNRDADVPLPRVVTDDVAVGCVGARHLMGCGFRNFAFAGLPGHAYSALRQEGFVRELAAAGRACHIQPDEAAGGGGERGTTPLSRWLGSLPRPLGIMGCSDIRAVHILNACEHLGWRVPRDAAVLGVDDDPLRCQIAGVPLSSVAPNSKRVGWLAADLLLRLMAGEPPPHAPVLVPPLDVVVRQSTDVVAGRDPTVVRAVRFIRDHAGESGLDVDTVARAAGASGRTLRRRFLAAVGWSPYEEILQTRMNRARRLLLDTNLSVKEIAAACGFTEPRHFTIRFRRMCGITATAFRERARV